MYTYKLKFTIFGKEMSAKITADGFSDMSVKLCDSVMRALRPTDCVILNADGNELTEAEYHQVLMKEGGVDELIKQIKQNLYKFSQN